MDIPNIASSKSNEKLKYGLNAGEVVEFVKTLGITPSDNLSAANHDTMNVSMAQMVWREYNSLPDYLREMNMIVTQASNQRSHIICLPAFAGFLPASLFPQYQRVLGEIRINSYTGLPDDMWIYQAFVGLASECFEVYFATMSALAAAHGIYIAAGSTVYKENGEFVHRALLFSPTGNLAGFQDKFSPTVIDQSMQIELATRQKVFDIHVGKIAFIINEDIDYFELVKAAYNQGARVIINPSAHIAPYNSSKAAGGLNLRVQEYPVYGVQPTLIGSTPIGFKLEGISGIYAPSKFSSSISKSCVYASAMKQNQTQVITSRLDIEELKKVKYYGNPEFMRKYIDYIY